MVAVLAALAGLLWPGLLAGSGLFYVWRLIIEQRRAGDRRAVAERVGLASVRAFPASTVTGTHGRLGVRMQSFATLRSGTRVVIEGVARGFQLRREDRSEPAPPDAVRIGDPPFDAAIVLAGPVPLVRALFDAETRALARDLCGLGLWWAVRFGELVVDLPEPLGLRSRLTPPLLERFLAFAARLREPVQVETRLVEVAGSDPVPAVRLAALQTLTSQASARAAIRTAHRAAHGDSDPALRLAGALALGSAGVPVLHALAADPDARDQVSASAIAGLGGMMTFERVRPILDAAVAAGRVQTACAALRVMGRGGAKEAAIITAVLARTEGALAVAAVEALGDTLAPVAEAPLVRSLAEDLPRAVAAARSLARLGTARAVPELMTAEGRGGELGRAARQAIASIQSRLTGATPGQVSLASGTGELSVVESADGRVTLADE